MLDPNLSRSAATQATQVRKRRSSHLSPYPPLKSLILRLLSSHPMLFFIFYFLYNLLEPPNWFIYFNLSWPLNSVSHNSIQGSTTGTTGGNITIVSGPGIPALKLNGINTDIKLGDVQKTCIADPNLCTEGMSIIFWLKLDSLADSYSRQTREGFILSSGAELPGYKGVSVHLSDSKIYVTLSTKLKVFNCNASYVKDEWTLVTISWSNASGLILYYNSSLVASSVHGVTVTLRTAVSNKLYVGRSVGDQPNHAGFSICLLAVQYGLVSLVDIQRILISGLFLLFYLFLHFLFMCAHSNFLRVSVFLASCYIPCSENWVHSMLCGRHLLFYQQHFGTVTSSFFIYQEVNIIPTHLPKNRVQYAVVVVTSSPLHHQRLYSNYLLILLLI